MSRRMSRKLNEEKNKWREYTATGPFFRKYKGLLHENSKIFVGYRTNKNFMDNTKPYVDWDRWHFYTVEVLIDVPVQNRTYYILVIKSPEVKVPEIMEGMLEVGAPAEVVAFLPSYFAHNKALEEKAKQGIAFNTPYGTVITKIDEEGKIRWE